MRSRHDPVSFDLLKADSFIRGESTLAVVCEEAFEAVAARLEGSIAANGLALLHVHDLRQLLSDNGMALDIGCRVYEVFSPQLAGRLIALDPGLAHVLPCRISVHDRGDITTVTTPMPSTSMTEFSHAAEVARLARSFEAAMHRVLRGMKDDRWFDPVDPGSTTSLDLLVDAVRDARPPIVHTGTLTVARYPGDFDSAALTLELELAAQRISVLHRYVLSDLLAAEGLPIAQRAIVFDVWSADAAAALMARDPTHAAHLPWRIAVVQRGNDVLLLMPQRSAVLRPSVGAVDAGRRWTDRLQSCIANVVRAEPLVPLVDQS